MRLFLALLLLAQSHAQDERYIPSSTANILVEKYLDSLSYDSSLFIISDVPVTLQRYSDTSQSFLMGAEPVTPNLGMVVVTSDCSSEDTDVVPVIEVDGDSITVSLGVDGENKVFLQETTRYEAFWSYVYGMCGLASWSSASTELNAILEDTDAPAGLSEKSFPTPSPSANLTFITEATQALATTTNSDAESTSTVISNAIESTQATFDYEQCGFNCCANTDCEGCCIEGVCQPKENDFDFCAEPPIKPTEVAPCGPVAYKNFQVEGNCPSENLPSAVVTIPGEPITTSSTAASIERSTTSPEPEVPNPCVQGKCLDPEGECKISVKCLNDPCQAEENGCGDAECITNYCGGCNAVCVGITTSEVVVTTETTSTFTITTITTGHVTTTETTSPVTSNATTETTSTGVLSEPTSTKGSGDENQCAPGKCINFAGACAREVICLTNPCDALECNPDQECISNLCGGCNAFCSGGVTDMPSTNPIEDPSRAPTFSDPEPVQPIDETKPTESIINLYPNPPVRTIFAFFG